MLLKLHNTKLNTWVYLPVTAINQFVKKGDDNTMLFKDFTQEREDYEPITFRALHDRKIVAEAIEAAWAYTAQRDIPLPSFSKDGNELVYAWVLDLTQREITLEKTPVPVERGQIVFGDAKIKIKDNNPG